MNAFQAAEKALIRLCDDAAAAGDKDGHAALFGALQTVRAVGGYKAFPFAKKTNAAKQAEYRARKRNAAVTDSVTNQVTEPVTSSGGGGNADLLFSSSEIGKVFVNTEKEEESVTSARVTATVTKLVTTGASRGTRMPDDYEPREKTVTELKAEGYADPLSVLKKFRDHWRAQPGAKGVKLDWEATFRNWVRNEKTMGGASRFASKQIVQPSENRAWKLPKGAV